MIEYTVRVHSDVSEHWYLNGRLHRENGPAVEYANGNKTWYLNGELHREDGPAVDWAGSFKEWWINGQKLTKEEFNEQLKKPVAAPCEGREVEIDGVVYVLKAKGDK